MKLAQNLKQKAKNINPNWYFSVLAGFVFLEYVRPQDSYLAFLAPFKFPAFALILLATVFLKNNKSYLKEEVGYKLFIAFWFLTSFSMVYAVNTNSPYQASMGLMWMGVSFIFPIVVILNDIDKLLNFFNYWVFSQALVAITTILNGGRGPGGIVADENDVASALAMALPYAFYLFFFPSMSSRNKFLLLFAGILFAAAVVISASRGGMLGLGASLMMITIMSKKPMGNSIKITLFVLIFGGLIISFFPTAYIDDMANMTNTEDNTADDRLWSWSIAWVMFLDNPIWGVGAGNYNWMNEFYAEQSPMWYEGRHILSGRAAHSLYFSVLPELGLLGVFLYFAIIRVIYNRCRSIKKIVSNFPTDKNAIKIKLLASAFQASLVSFMVSSAFISVLYYPFIYHLLGMVLVTNKLVVAKYQNNLNNPPPKEDELPLVNKNKRRHISSGKIE